MNRFLGFAPLVLILCVYSSFGFAQGLALPPSGEGWQLMQEKTGHIEAQGKESMVIKMQATLEYFILAEATYGFDIDLVLKDKRNQISIDWDTSPDMLAFLTPRQGLSGSNHLIISGAKPNKISSDYSLKIYSRKVNRGQIEEELCRKIRAKFGSHFYIFDRWIFIIL